MWIENEVLLIDNLLIRNGMIETIDRKLCEQLILWFCLL